MGELLDFLVWLKRKGDKVPIKFIQALGVYACDFLEERRIAGLKALFGEEYEEDDFCDDCEFPCVDKTKCPYKKPARGIPIEPPL